MNRLILVGLAPLALAACGGGDGDEAAKPAPEADTAIVQPMVPGLYAIESADRIYSRTRLHTDGSYTDYDGGMNAVGGGRWSSEDAQICFDPQGDGENEQESCWMNEAPAEDGSFVTRLVKGETSYLVRPLEN